MEEIKINSKVSIYRTKLEDFSQEGLIEEAYCNNDIRDNPFAPQENSPGIQSDIAIINGKLEEYTKLINSKLITKFYPTSNSIFGFKNWVYISSNDTSSSFYHSHTKMPGLKCEGNWTWTFYIQVPKDIKGEEGKLSFLLEDDTVFNILPEEGDLFIFPASLQHRPLPSRDSIRDRIVLAGTLSKLNPKQRYTKNTKTIF